MTTEAQIKANRANAQKSTGPTSAAGKERVRYNAFTHGLLANSILLTEEETEVYYELFEDLIESLEPVGRLEFLLVEKIVISYWRLRRATGAESGVLDEKAEMLRGRLQGNDYANANVDLKFLTRSSESERDPLKVGDSTYAPISRAAAAGRVRSSSHGVRHLIETLTTLEERLKRRKGLTKGEWQWLEREFGEDGNALAARLAARMGKKLEVTDDRLRAGLQLIGDELSVLQELKEKADLRLDVSFHRQWARECVPSEEDVQNIQRYETRYDRDLYRAMNELDRLQARRRARESA